MALVEVPSREALDTEEWAWLPASAMVRTDDGTYWCNALGGWKAFDGVPECYRDAAHEQPPAKKVVKRRRKAV